MEAYDPEENAEGIKYNAPLLLSVLAIVLGCEAYSDTPELPDNALLPMLASAAIMGLSFHFLVRWCESPRIKMLSAAMLIGIATFVIPACIYLHDEAAGFVVGKMVLIAYAEWVAVALIAALFHRSTRRKRKPTKG